MKFLDYEIEVPDNEFVSMGWNMYVNRNRKDALQHREMKKARFIPDPLKRRDRMRQIQDGGNDNEIGCSVSSPEIPNWEAVGFANLSEFFNLASSSMFYNVNAEVSSKRITEVEAFAMEVLQDSKHKISTYDEVCYLIDQQYEFHTGVFDHAQSDLAFQKQYNQLLYDILEKRIWEVAANESIDLVKELDKVIRNPLVWNATALSLGTVFGSLYDEGIIKGTKTDLHRAVNYLFGISTETTKAAMNHKMNKNEGKVYYDPETAKMIEPWIAHLKTTAPKTGKRKQAKKKP